MDKVDTFICECFAHKREQKVHLSLLTPPHLATVQLLMYAVTPANTFLHFSFVIFLLSSTVKTRFTTFHCSIYDQTVFYLRKLSSLVSRNLLSTPFY